MLTIADDLFWLFKPFPEHNKDNQEFDNTILKKNYRIVREYNGEFYFLESFYQSTDLAAEIMFNMLMSQHAAPGRYFVVCVPEIDNITKQVN